MKRHLRHLFQSAVILVTLQLTAQAQPALVTEIPNGSTNFVTVGDLVFFTSANSLWRTDGTAAGTILLKSGFTIVPNSFREFNNMLIFTTSASELWRSDGTPSGTIQLITTSSIGILGSTSSLLFFTAHDAATGQELYKTDGTPGGTQLIKDVFPGSGSGFRGRNAVVGNYLFFNGDDGTHGFELWKTDGTSGGTAMVKDILPGAGHGYGGNATAFVHNNLFYFSGNTVENGMEPWVSDGTAAGTILLSDTEPGPNNPAFIEYKIGNGQTVYFMVFAPRSPEGSATGPADLWKTHGTPASTVRVDAMVDADDFSYESFLVYQGKIYFFAIKDRSETQEAVFSTLWVTDGTAEGTNRVFDLRTHYGRIQFFEVVDGYMLFYGTDELGVTCMIRSNGTNAGTELAFCFNANYHPYLPRDVIKIGDLIFFGDHENGEMGNPEQPDDYYQLIHADAFTRASIRQIYGGSYVGTDNITDYNGRVLFTTYDDFSGTGNSKKLWIHNPGSPIQGTFTLVNADTDEDIRVLVSGDVISKSETDNINIRFDPAETPGSVRFTLNGSNVRTENAAPYSLAGDVNGNYAPWTGASPGSYTLTATPYSGSGAGGTAGTPVTIHFTIETATGGEECMASGTILREYWGGIPGNYVSAVPQNSPPQSTSQLSLFEGPTNSGTNYAARVRGYICPPATGNYTFWIASNDHSELWLSSDDNPSNKKRIAYVTGATNPRQWDKFSTQKSAPIPLTAGKRYYIEALHKQGAGSDNLAVGWQLPDATMERPIPGNRLSPFSDSGGENQAPQVTITNPFNGQTYIAPADITIEADASDTDGNIVKVEFFERRSYILEDFRKIGEDLTAPYSIIWEDAQPAEYVVTARVHDDDGATGDAPWVYVIVNGDCNATGSITREFWYRAEGNRVSDIPLDTPPTGSHELTSFEGPVNSGTNYGARIRGYICPPITGDYSFFISSNDHSELFLSTDEDPSKKIRIAYVSGATSFREFYKFGSQVSDPISLIGGKKYYIEALHKQGVGSDHISVMWRLPNTQFEEPIPGSRLSPYEVNAAMAAGANEAQFSHINIYPNPAQSGAPQLSISGFEGIQQTIETQVEIINLTGEVVYAEKISCGGDCGSYLMNINEQLVPGVYLVNMKTNGIKISKHLLVK